ncbi:MAG: hypothetical protein WBP12_03240 [Candidatus Saccharimonas sp.]
MKLILCKCRHAWHLARVFIILYLVPRSLKIALIRRQHRWVLQKLNRITLQQSIFLAVQQMQLASSAKAPVSNKDTEYIANMLTREPVHGLAIDNRVLREAVGIKD